MRYLTQYVADDLKRKMVFISGPRQSGKTTLVKELLKSMPGMYLNWDDTLHRKKIMARTWSDEENLIALDEINKYSKWKNFVKGTYDTQKERHRFIVTGSAKLDIYKKGQDSMLGRFFSYRLHPLCLSELKHIFNQEGEDCLKKLLDLGGFPEPYLTGSLLQAKRWRKEKQRLVFRQDIQELESIKDISLFELFHLLLTQRVASEVVLSNLALDLDIAPKTAKVWLNILEKTYSVFSIRPFSKGMNKAIKKSPKIYFYDNGEVDGDLGAKLENLVASHLLKKLRFLEDIYGDTYELCYLRDKQGHEIDFVIVKNRKPTVLIEVKVSDSSRSKSFYYYKERLKVEKCVQLVMNLEKKSTKDGIRVIPLIEWLSRPLEDDSF